MKDRDQKRDCAGLSVVIPVHNETENVEKLIAETSGALEGRLEYEIVCVDDGSTDSSMARLKELMPRFPRLRVMHHRRRCGQSTALRTGIKKARFPLIATMDGDLQNDPADIMRLVEEFLLHGKSEEKAMVVGFRKTRRDTHWRRMTSWVANSVRSRVLKDETPDTGCGLKVFCRETFLDLPYFENMHRFLPALVCRAGGRVVSVTVRHRPRVCGRSHYRTLGRLIAGIIDLFGVGWLMARSRSPMVEEIRIDHER